ncbi:hypothetical protein D3C71_1772380 [compost metagenome]
MAITSVVVRLTRQHVSQVRIANLSHSQALGGTLTQFYTVVVDCLWSIQQTHIAAHQLTGF